MTIYRTIEISKPPAFDELPADIRDSFCPEDREAYEQGAAMFKRSAHETDETSLIALLSDLDDDQRMRVYLRREDPEAWTIWFGFNFMRRKKQPRFRAPRHQQFPHSIPDRVRKLYEGFGGIDDVGWGCFGIMPPEWIQSGDELAMDDSTVDPSTCYFFFSYGNGDYLGWNADGDAVLFNHERAEFEVFEGLDPLLDQYFEELLEPGGFLFGPME